MSAKDNLIKNVLIFSIGNLGSRLLVFFLVPLFSHYLSTSEMGFYDLVVVTVGLIVPLATVQISDSIYRWLVDIKNNDFHQTISSSVSILMVVVLFVLFVFCAGSIYFSLQYKWLIAGYFFSSCFYPYILAVARGMKLNKLYAVSGIVNSAVLVTVNWVLLAKFSMGVQGMFVANIAASSVAGILLLYGTKLYNYISIKSISKVLIVDFLRFSFPLIPNTISWWLINSANRYIILYFMGENSNGVFALSSRVAMALYALNSIFNLAWQESAITEFDKEGRDKFYSEVFNKYFILEMTVIILLIPLSKLFVIYFVGEQFQDSWKYMPMLLIGVGFATFSAFFGTGYLSAKQTFGAFSTTIYGALVNVILAIILVPKIGLHGASIGIVIGFVTTLILRIYQTRKFFNIEFEKRRMVVIIILVIISTLLIFYTNSILGLTVFAIAGMISFFIFNLEMLKDLMNKISKRTAKL